MTLEIQEFIIGGSILGGSQDQHGYLFFNSGSKDQLYKKEEPDPNKGSNQL